MQSSTQGQAAATAASSSGASSITLDSVKQATLSGALTYQAFDYWGKKLNNDQSGGTNGCCQISHQNISFQLESASGSSGSTGTGAGGTSAPVKLAEL